MNMEVFLIDLVRFVAWALFLLWFGPDIIEWINRHLPKGS